MHSFLKRSFPLLLAVGLLLPFGCSEKEEADPEYGNWPSRNDAAFADSMLAARRSIAAARAQWGAAWESHCDRRVLRNYAMGAEARADRNDSVVVRILRRGTGSGSPLSTDTVRVVYVGRLIPTVSRPSGYVFDHSGASADTARVFDPLFAQTAKFGVSGVVPGFATALQHMRIGDRWRLIIPSRLAYGTTAYSGIPASSTLIFDVELRAYSRVH